MRLLEIGPRPFVAAAVVVVVVVTVGCGADRRVKNLPIRNIETRSLHKRPKRILQNNWT